ncbi:hypothetical protein EVAR_61566_1 [Eumeta japonica]|uniref:Uncharacterized protein n=1 Tax=Eumeta variegata TaxID=151549 RepID=A0A4C1YW34_EUMVA|nr:hypothetical protein EVAR_61566_1 [Eumeta japonica]
MYYTVSQTEGLGISLSNVQPSSARSNGMIKAELISSQDFSQPSFMYDGWSAIVSDSFVLGSSATLFPGRRYGTEDLMLPHARASSRRRYDPDGSGGNGPLLGDPIVGV